MIIRDSKALFLFILVVLSGATYNNFTLGQTPANQTIIVIFIIK